MAEYLEERTFRQGQALIPGDRPVGSIHFVVSGMVRATFREVTVGVVEPPKGVGMKEIHASMAAPGGAFVRLTDACVPPSSEPLASNSG